jgi:hypothetical protein
LLRSLETNQFSGLPQVSITPLVDADVSGKRKYDDEIRDFAVVASAAGVKSVRTTSS